MNRMFTSTVYWSFALELRDWDATWYCIDSIARAAKKALYAHGDNQNALRDNESTLCDVTCVDLARFVLIFHVLTWRDLD